MHLKLTKELIEKAVYALKGTAYEKNKKIIRTMFDLPTSMCPVIMRLWVIDSCYSTNFKKRQFGFEELAQAIEDLGPDREVEKRLRKLLSPKAPSVDEKIASLFRHDNWGIVRGRKSGHARSLISKYFYFLSNYQFPIYDANIEDGLKSKYINEKFPEGRLSKEFCFLEKLTYLKTKYDTTYDHLDQFFWLWGKTYSEKAYGGSYSLIIHDKELYLKINRKSRDRVCEILEKENRYRGLRIFIRSILNAKYYQHDNS